ncbi:hypothetical protein, partial [Algoriphagus aquimarinus]
MKNLYKASVFGLLSLVFLFFLGNTFTVNAQGGTATVTTDKDDYAPGEYVIINGSGWEPGERVDFTFEETPKPETCVNSHDNFAIADPNGDIYYDGFLIKDNHLGVAFVLTATGQISGRVAVTEFTDAGIANVGVVGTSFCAGISITVNFETVSANVGFGGGQFPTTADFYAELSNASGSFSTPIIIGFLMNTSGNGAREINATIPSSTVTGSGYRIRVRSEDPVTNQPDNGVNLVITAAASISSQPANAGIIYGDNATFSVTTSGATGFQWEEFNGSWSPLTNGGIYSGVNTATLTLTKPSVNLSGRKYRVVLTGACGNVTSDGNATLTVNKKALTAASTVASKEYNGSPATGAVSLGTVSGLVGTETLVITSSATNYINADAGVGKATTISYNLADGTNGGLAANYSMADFATTGVITKANQTITVTTPSPATAIYNTNFSVVATATSGLAVVYTSTAPLSNSGTDYTMTSGTGTGVVRYNQAGNNNYNAAPEVTANVNAAKADAVITVTPYSVTYDGNAHTSTFTAVGVETTPVDLTGL